MGTDRKLTRRSFVVGGGAALGALVGGGASAAARAFTRAGAGDATIAAVGDPRWQQAALKGIVYGSSTTTWQIEPDPAYSALFQREAGMLFTEDDLLWWRLKPTPSSELDFSYADRIVAYAEGNGQHVFGAHLVWDEGFGDGWTFDDLWGMTEEQARNTLYPTVQAEVSRYAGRIRAWVAANEVTDEGGVRVDTPWYETIGPEYIADVFNIAHANDPAAVLVINEFGFEQGSGRTRALRRQGFLQVIDMLLAQGVPVHAAGIQAHLTYRNFARQFNETAYRAFLADLAARGLPIMITEMDVLDDGLPGRDIAARDAGVADIYRRYLDVALDEPAVKVFLTFGLTDRYTWLQEDRPRRDGAARRPLPFDANLQPKPAYDAIVQAFANAPVRDPLWVM
jgi:endo-1,4-beta-xylanase